MAAPSCNYETLLTQSGCFSGKTLTKNQQIAVKIYFLAAQLAAIGGTNYLGALGSTLMTDSRCRFQAYTPDDYRAVDIVIEKNNAVSAGASISSNIDTVVTQVNCLQNAQLGQLRAAEQYLRCQLGRAKAYPQ
jgi:hypothetical protein